MKCNKQNNKKLLQAVESLGNALPHPVIIFIIFIAILLIFSAIGEYFDVTAIDPRPEGVKGRAEDGIIRVVNLLDADGIRKILSNVVTNFTSFTPLGTVLVSLLGVGIAERSGLLSTVIRFLIIKSPRKLTTLSIVFAGIMSNAVAELGYVVLIPLSALIFHSLDRHPLAGLAAAFAGVSGGYSANLLLGAIDPLLSGITQQAARIVDSSYVVGAEANWYFMFMSTFLITIIGYYVTEKIVEPQLGIYKEEQEITKINLPEITSQEKKALMAVLVTFIVFLSFLLLSIFPEHSILRNQETRLISNSPFLASIVVFICLFFSILGMVYGFFANTFKSLNDVVNAMEYSMSTLGLYLVITFFSSQFIAFFEWSNIGQIIAVYGANFLNNINLSGWMLFIGFILVCAFINLIIGSASAQWAITAPIFVPMLMLAGYSPEIVQAAYRIGDSVTNIITPMMGYFGMIVAISMKYKKDTGVGTIISIMIPYSLFFLIGWSLFFCIWVFVFNFPVGPNSSTYYKLS
ncbi:AbgT family transporter [Photorhabdus viridis]|uniref:AbgT family transporter n=1 Tax=Photorhabdus viridis TaxID=3163327 RepID=UPI00330704CE